jgi:hypothetical protein
MWGQKCDHSVVLPSTSARTSPLVDIGHTKSHCHIWSGSTALLGEFPPTRWVSRCVPICSCHGLSSLCFVATAVAISILAPLATCRRLTLAKLVFSVHQIPYCGGYHADVRKRSSLKLWLSSAVAICWSILETQTSQSLSLHAHILRSSHTLNHSVHFWPPMRRRCTQKQCNYASFIRA